MSSSLRRGALAAAAIAFSIASLAACGAGSNAQTLQIKPDNAATSVGDVKVQNALVITEPDGTAEGPAVVSATIYNNGDTAQTLDSVTVDGAGGPAELKPAKGSGKVTVPAHGYIVLGGKDNAAASLASAGQNVKAGNVQKVTFSLSKTGDVSLKALVVPAESYFTKWGPSEVPTAPGASASASAKPSSSASGSPAGTASESASGAAADSSGTPTDAASASASGAAAGN
ncbi:DUF461 domain-containing protein [Streptomyces sp. NPDC008313]|uniref:DUF461 domain-containing protein n=1 Tax=Streptomyces sp. NPDC008313 TaxID=3364826 RepID=UPI0036E0697B